MSSKLSLTLSRLSDTVSPRLASAAANLRSEAEVRATRIAAMVKAANTTADSLKWLSGNTGDVFLNVFKDQFSGTRVDWYGTAHEAREHAADGYDEREPSGDYLSTIVLSPDGTWREEYLFRS
jgi:hypothetical protein